MRELCGLLSRKAGKKNIPLKSISVHADVRGLAAAVIAELKYENPTDEIMECEFVFPMNDTSAVYKLEMEVADQKIVAECRPRKEAEEQYTDAVKAGFQSALLESQENTSDIFRLLLGNLPSKETAKLTIGYAQPLERSSEDGVLTLNLPTVLNTRYVPHHILEDPAELQKHFLSSSMTCMAFSSISYEMTFGAKISLGVSAQISGIESAHKDEHLDVQYDDDRYSASVSLVSKYVPDHDFRLHITPADAWTPIIYIEPGIQKTSEASPNWLNYNVAAVWFEPKQSAEQRKSKSIPGDEYWLVIDRSGSMSGSNIRHAKEALLLFIKSLPIGCKFNVIGFGDRFDCLFSSGAVDYTAINVEEAVQHAAALGANMGGTEILAPLAHIFSQPPPVTEDARRFVIIFTDGDVSNTKEVISLVKSNASRNSVFAIGIGDGASTALVNGVARASGGMSEFVRSADDRLQEKVISLLAATASPVTENLRLDWSFAGGNLVSLSPSQLPKTVYQGKSICQFAVFEKDSEADLLNVSANLSAVIDGTLLKFEGAGNFGSKFGSVVDDCLPLHRLAAMARLLEIENEKEENEHISKAVAISLATGVLCKETALVAVDRNRVNQNPEEKTHYLSFHLPHQRNLGGLSGQLQAISQALQLNLEQLETRNGKLSSISLDLDKLSLQSQAFYKSAKKSNRGIFDSLTKWFGFGRSSSSSSSSSSVPIATPSKSEKPSSASTTSSSSTSQACLGYMDLIALQQIDGSWTLNRKLVDFLDGLDVNSTRLLCEECLQIEGLQFQPSDEFIGTLIGVAILRRKYSNQQQKWQLIERKAVSFLVGSNGFSEELLEKCVEAFAQKALFN